MADPTKYDPSYNFSNYQASNPATPLPGSQVDIQFQALKTTTDETIEALKNIRRSDGALKNGIVTADSLASSLSIGFTLRGNWVVDTVYMAGDGVVYGDVFYKARVAHTATNLNRPDLDPDTWTYLASIASISIADGSIVPAKLSNDDAGFRAKIGAASIAQADYAANTHAATAKTSLVDADELSLWDSVSEALRKITWASFKAMFTAMFVRYDAAQALSVSQQGQARSNIDAAAAMDTQPSLIVNGSMIDSQENGNTLGTTNGYFAADQWALYFTAATAAMSIQRVQSSKSLAGSKNKLEFKTTTAKASLGASDFVMLSQPIEGSRPEFVAAGWGAAGAKQFVLRFEATLPAGAYHVHVQNSAGNRHITVPFTVAGGDANTAKVHEVIIPGDTSGTWLTGDGQIGMVIDIVLAAGATLTGGTASTWGATTYYAASTQTNILSSTSNVARLADVGLRLDPDATGVYGQYEVGEVHPVYRSERYYERIADDASSVPWGTGHARDANQAQAFWQFDFIKAKAPSVTGSAATSAFGFYRTNTNTGDLEFNSAPFVSKRGAMIYLFSGTGLTAGQGGEAFFVNAGGGWLAANARLS
jgi:hypothetical protein